MAFGYLEVTPIRYHLKAFDLAGSIQMGALAGSSNIATNYFYGGALTASFNKQIGITMDTKVSNAYKTVSAISLIGYY